MKAHGHTPRSLREMAAAVGVETNSIIGGTISGIRKNTSKAGFGDEAAVLTKLKDGRYIAGPALTSNEIPEQWGQNVA